MHSGLIRLLCIGEAPLQLRRNWQPLGERAQALEERGLFLRRHRESDAQPPFKPTRGEHGFPKAHQQIIKDAAGLEGRTGRVEGLETEGIETQVLFEFLDAGSHSRPGQHISG